MVIRFLIADAYSVGGTIRTTFNTASDLADRGHDVEIVSAYRPREEPALALNPRVRLRPLADVRPGRQSGWQRWAIAQPSRLIHPDDVRYPKFSALTDAGLLRFIPLVGDGVLVGTRPGINLAIARLARPTVARVGQDHMNLGGYRPGLVAALAEHYPRLDLVTALVEPTAEGYRKMLGTTTRVECVPNAAPDAGAHRAGLEERVIASAGTLDGRKGFDRLIRAWALIAAQHPDWRLDIFGDGPERDALARLAADLGVAASVRLRGHTSRLTEELARTSLFVMTSRREGFPMVLLEAMSVGVPVIAYDCPTGPRDVVDDGVDGYVVADGHAAELAAAMAALIRDPGRRRAFGAAAVRKAARYGRAELAERWETLFAELLAAKGARRGARERRAA
jgi:glycosyltransferase involved in cell wall biosynthesis